MQFYLESSASAIMNNMSPKREKKIYSDFEKNKYISVIAYLQRA